MQAQAPQFPILTLDQAKAALREAIAAFEVPENRSRMEAAIAGAAGDPFKRMMLVLPLVEDIQRDSMARYGFSGPGAVMAGTMQIAQFASLDPEIADGVRLLSSKLSGN